MDDGTGTIQLTDDSGVSPFMRSGSLGAMHAGARAASAVFSGPGCQATLRFAERSEPREPQPDGLVLDLGFPFSIGTHLGQVGIELSDRFALLMEEALDRAA